MIELHCGDCLEVMKTMPDNSVDAVITDPPYFKVKGEWWDNQWDTATGFIVWIGQLCEQWQRILKPNGSLYVFASPKMSARVEVKIGETFNVLNRITWEKEKDRGKHEQTCKEILRRYFPNTESIIFAEHYGADNIAKCEAGYQSKCDDLRGFIFEPLRAYLDGERIRAGVSRKDINYAFSEYTNKTGCLDRSVCEHYFGRAQWCLPTQEIYENVLRPTLSRLNHGGEYLKREYEYLKREYDDLKREYDDLKREYEELRRPFSVTADVPYTDVWDFPTVQFYAGKHPCEKPLAMMEHIINTSTKPGAVVLDCFSGSGVTGEACQRLGRNAILIDVEQKWIKYAQQRIAYAQMQPSLITEGS